MAKKDVPNEDSAAEHSRTEPKSKPTRRSYLKLGASALAGAGLLGRASVDVRGATGEIDIVEAGADPNGNEPIDDVLEQVVTDGAVVTFPSDGEFLMHGTTLNADDFELRGNGARLYPEGGFVTINGQNWTMDGFEIDMRSDSTYPHAIVAGGNYTVSRCIWRGQAGSGDGRAVFPKYGSGTVKFVDCYWPDGAVDGGEGSNFGCLGSFSNYQNSGHLVLERCWFHGWSEDTAYFSEVSGKVTMVDCYFVNTIVGPRVSDVTLRRVKSVHTEPIPVERWSGSSFQSGAWLNGSKGVSGDVLIEDCDFYITGPSAGKPIKGSYMPGPTTVRNTRIHNTANPTSIELGTKRADDITLDNVTISGNDTVRLGGNVRQRDVTTVDGEAADPSPHIPTPPPDGSIPGEGNGNGGTDDGNTEPPADGDWNSLVIEGDGNSGTGAQFSFSVSGDLEHLTPDDPVLQSDHGVDGSTATEDVWSETERYRFTGEITEFQLDGPATVVLNGEQVDPSTLGSSTDGHTLTVEGDGNPNSRATFSVTVSGDLEHLTPEDPVLQSRHGVDGSTATEDVWSETERYRFTGEITAFELDGPATVRLDGEQVDPATLGTTWNELAIAGDGDATTGAQFSFSVSGDLEHLTPDDPVLQSDHGVDGSTATEDVWSETERYRFTGEITEFQLDGPATVHLNGETVDAGSLV